MESRLQMMESMLQHVVSAKYVGSGEVTATQGMVLEHGRLLDSHEGTGARAHSRNTAGEDTADGMGSVTFAGEAVRNFFGPSSNSAFNTHIMRALTLKIRPGHDRPGREHTSVRDLSAALSRPSTPPPPTGRQPLKQLNPYFLPPQAEILRLVDSFFATTGLFFPYIDKTSLIETVRQLDGDHSPAIRRSALCLLNAVMACGAILTTTDTGDVKADETQADAFGRRAMELSPWTTSNTATLETGESCTVPSQLITPSLRRPIANVGRDS